jgi:riboflavin synthase
MFTGIIACVGEIVAIEAEDSNVSYTIKSSISSQLKIDQSIAHNGVCLTVVAINGDTHRVTAIDETLKKTNLQQWSVDDSINLEQCLRLGDRLDGHLVQGHVDGIGTVESIIDSQGSWVYQINYPEQHKDLLVEKGSICLNGISLTVVNLTNTSFEVCIIPYTYSNTTMQFLKINSHVNLEFDIIGKYIQRKNEY